MACRLVGLQACRFRVSSLVQPLSRGFKVKVCCSSTGPGFLSPLRATTLLAGTGRGGIRRGGGTGRTERRCRHVTGVNTRHLRPLIPASTGTIVVNALQMDRYSDCASCCSCDVTEAIVLNFSGRAHGLFSRVHGRTTGFRKATCLTRCGTSCRRHRGCDVKSNVCLNGRGCDN